MHDSHHQAEARRTAIGVPRFSLATLMIAMGIVSTLFAVMAAVGPVPSLLLTLFLGLAAAHVIGNAIGTSLRDQTTAAYVEHAPLQREQLPSCTTSQTGPLLATGGVSRGLRTCTAVGASLGGLLGGSTLAFANWDHINPAGIALGALSSAVLAGLFVFLVTSFVTTCRRAIRDALSASEAP